MQTRSLEEISTSYGTQSPCELTSEMIDQFNMQGYLYLKEAFDSQKALKIQEKIWEIVAEYNGVDRNKPDTWARPWKGFNKKEAWANDLSPERLRRAFDDLLGPGGWTADRWGGTLLQAYEPVEMNRDWYIRRGEWHWDGRPDFGLPGLGVFTIFSILPPHAGGTLLVAGSHRLISRFFDDMPLEKRSRPTKIQKKSFRKRFGWYSELQDNRSDDHDAVTSKYMDEGIDSEGVHLNVVEVVGEPGDAVIFHPWIIHSRPAYYGSQPRFLRLGGAGRK